jgi:hypothetical protein
MLVAAADGGTIGLEGFGLRSHRAPAWGDEMFCPRIEILKENPCNGQREFARNGFIQDERGRANAR